MPRCQQIFAGKTIFFVRSDVLAFISAIWDCPAVSPLFLQVGVVPVTRKAQALTDIVFGLIAQQRARTGDVRQGMAYVSRPEITVGRFGLRRFGLVADDLVTDKPEKLVERGPLAEGHIVDEVPGVVRSIGCQQVRLHHIVDIAEIAGRFAVPLTYTVSPFVRAANPLRYYRRIRAVRVDAGRTR